MALFDIDKDSVDRGSPNPNRHDQVSPDSLMAKQTLSHAYATNNTALQGTRMVLKNNMIVTYDSSNRVSSVYGYLPQALSSGPVLIVAKAGFDVFTDILGVTRPAGL